MGVTGLWRLIEPSGNLVPLQTLDDKVLAVDVSIWLHQAIKGFQNAHGGTLPNAHLLGIYHRICKLLFFGIKPVVVFDGGVPTLKQQTIFQRANKRSKALSEAETIHNKLVSALLKHTAISNILSDESKTNLIVKPVKEGAEDIYKLPTITELNSTVSSEDESSSFDSSPNKSLDLHSIDEKSQQFKALPADVRHDILTDLKETRKQSSWGRLHELPKKSDDFSIFQMKRLLKRYSIQVSLEEVEKEMGGRSLSLAELETLLKDQGVVTNDDKVGKRIASDENKRFLLIKDLKKAMDEAKKEEVKKQNSMNVQDQDDVTKGDVETIEIKESGETKSEEKHNAGDVEFEDDLKLAIELSLQDVPSTSKQIDNTKHKKLHELSFLQDFGREDFHTSSDSEDDAHVNNKVCDRLASVKNYMVEYSGLTPSEISKIMNDKEDTKATVDNALSNQNISIPFSPKTSLDSQDSLISVKVSTNPSKLLTMEVAKDCSESVKQTKNVNVSIEEENSESDDSDFVEVIEGAISQKKDDNLFEVIVKPEETLRDDLFDDVFGSCTKEVLPTQEIKCVGKTISNKIREKISADSSAAQDSVQVIEEKIEPISIIAESEKVENVIIDENGKEEVSEKAVKEEKVPAVTHEQLKEIQRDLQLENVELIREQLAKERMANSLSEQIVQETQDLLQLFGIPYIVAPMEAEAQCAFLEIINLTDGTITDDSDIWLFGGKTVYKNFFNHQKQVLEYRAEKIQHHYKLSREQMILLALLVGSDYTLGLQGVGPVTALEILGMFPSPKKLHECTFNYHQLISGLVEFRKWLNGEITQGFGRNALRSKLKNVTITETFPNLDVVRAYLEPNIDINKNPFSWGQPNVEGLIEYAKRKFGWERSKSESILKPVLKNKETQKSITDYFKTKHKIEGDAVENKMSKRVKIAVDKINRGTSNSDDDNVKPYKKASTKKLKKHKNDADVTSCGLSSDEDVQVLQKVQKQTKTKMDRLKREVESQLSAVKKVPTAIILHKKEVIPQKQKDKADALRKKIKAIEAFRKSKVGPGFVRARKRVVKQPKADAELSESSSD